MGGEHTGSSGTTPRMTRSAPACLHRSSVLHPATDCWSVGWLLCQDVTGSVLTVEQRMQEAFGIESALHTHYTDIYSHTHMHS